MHQNIPLCPVCGDDDEPDPDCWHCRGSGLRDPDAVGTKMADLARPATPAVRHYVECPRCKNLMGKPGNDGEVWCNRCQGYTRPYDDVDVLNDPSILEG